MEVNTSLCLYLQFNYPIKTGKKNMRPSQTLNPRPQKREVCPLQTAFLFPKEGQ